MAAPSLFISYASQDREAARALRDALSAAGFDVWYDENELGGGDAWDQKIRRQIRECTYFMPVISATTDARPEGYFRREWRLAVERTLDMADDVRFLVPVVIDGTSQARARVPEKFLSVQWLAVPGGQPTQAFSGWAQRLRVGEDVIVEAASPPLSLPLSAASGRPVTGGAARRKVGGTSGGDAASTVPREYPKFPDQRPDHTLHFLFSVVGWALKTAWVWYLGLSKGWRRIVLSVLIILFLNRACSSRRAQYSTGPEERDDAAKAKVGMDIAANIAQSVGATLGAHAPVVVFTFAAPGTDAATAKQTRAIFHSLSVKLAVAAPGKIGFAGPPPSDPSAAARLRDAEKYLVGTVGGAADARVLEVKLYSVDKAEPLTVDQYDLKGADPGAIADQIAKLLQANLN